ncbi:MAG: transglycosylase SLT domain-containing protein, partial [Paraprevotella sp.]|nr:transglycosylase SLT domain-containing protein [Paraprevotella sp.]
MKELSLVFLFLLFFSSCLHQEKRDVRSLQQNISGNSDNIYDLDHIQETGELIAVTISGRDTYYKYKGKNWGVQFELCQAFANSIGARLRMETVRDTNELFVKLKECEADIIALEIPQTYSISSDVCFAGSWYLTGNGSQGVKQQWVVRKSSPLLKEALEKWYMPSLRTYLTERENSYFLPSSSSNRKVHAPILNRKKGVISPYDATFIRHAPSLGWDWRLLAAQCYQESAFDTQAISWAGAVGLMQIMPETAEHLNINSRYLQQPEKNIHAAVLYLR